MLGVCYLFRCGLRLLRALIVRVRLGVLLRRTDSVPPAHFCWRVEVPLAFVCLEVVEVEVRIYELR